MKNEILKSLCVLCFVLILATNVKSQSNDELKSKIENLNKEMGSAMLSGNTEKSISFYLPDAISLPNNGKMLEGKDAIRKSNEDMMKSGMKVTSFETKTVKVMSCDKTITEIGKYMMTLSIPGQTEPIKDHGKYLTIWEKQGDGSLKVKLEIWNTDINPMEKMH